MIDSKRLGFAGGILWAVYMFIMYLMAMNAGDTCMSMPMMMPSIEMTGGGFIVAIIAGFVHGFVFLFLLGWLYNRLPHSRKR